MRLVLRPIKKLVFGCQSCSIRDGLSPFIVRSDSALLIFMFLSEKMGLLMQSDFAKSDGIKSDLRI